MGPRFSAPRFSMLGVRCSVLGTRYSVLDAQRSTLNARCPVPGARCPAPSAARRAKGRRGPAQPHAMRRTPYACSAKTAGERYPCVCGAPRIPPLAGGYRRTAATVAGMFRIDRLIRRSTPRRRRARGRGPGGFLRWRARPETANAGARRAGQPASVDIGTWTHRHIGTSARRRRPPPVAGAKARARRATSPRRQDFFTESE
ncbi:hypothetical protein BURPS1710A_A3100 [Burkholderia pseudomallei 1710a]|uniref:Uncharacterized protein n=1 Tax=Burkholderia pseudomallei 1710a TaxID=320371 RepID=A0A0E1VVR1_BURPE|nr:hypothetical protein BURPS1710A_A3100 [Burkholderia pseudomallei 1710a]